jgi:hypothetical protein
VVELAERLTIPRHIIAGDNATHLS